MGYTGPLPDRVLKLVPRSDRKQLGVAGETYDEAQARGEAQEEREMHRAFEQWLRLNGILFVHSIWARKATIQPGWPDFTVILGARVCMVEFKGPTGHLSTEQRDTIAKLTDAGSPVVVATSIEQAIAFVRQHRGSV